MGKRKPKAEVIMVSNSCGCVFCDLDLEPNTRIKNMFGINATAEYFHPTKQGDVPCTKPR